MYSTTRAYVFLVIANTKHLTPVILTDLIVLVLDLETLDVNFYAIARERDQLSETISLTKYEINAPNLE